MYCSGASSTRMEGKRKWGGGFATSRTVNTSKGSGNWRYGIDEGYFFGLGCREKYQKGRGEGGDKKETSLVGGSSQRMLKLGGAYEGGREEV